jgi:hypothetical protein
MVVPQTTASPDTHYCMVLWLKQCAPLVNDSEVRVYFNYNFISNSILNEIFKFNRFN